MLWKSPARAEKILQTRHEKRSATDVFRAEVDFEQVLYRMALHAQSLFTAAACLGRRDELVLPGGDSAADLVRATLLKLLDPLDTSVTWSSTKGPPTTNGVLAYLREVLRRDFLDLVRSKRAKTSVYPDDERTGDQDLSESSLDQRTSSFGNPEDERLRFREWYPQFRQMPAPVELPII